MDKERGEEVRGPGTPGGMQAQCADAEQALETQPHTCTDPFSVIE